MTRTKADGTRESLKTSYEYDGNGRLTKTIYPDSTFTQTTYNSIGKVDTSTDARGNQTKYLYDSDGRTQQVTYADTTVDTFQYDLEGHKTAQTLRGVTTSIHL